MSFTQPAFIRKNTPELRKKLEVLGYKFSGADHIELDCIVTFPDKNLYSIFAMHHFNIYDNSFKRTWKEYIDCGTNEDLFLALAALRDDTPINSYYWFNDKLVTCYSVFDLNVNQGITYRFMPMDNPKICFSANINVMRKATVKEIVKHFKDR